MRPLLAAAVVRIVVVVVVVVASVGLADILALRTGLLGLGSGTDDLLAFRGIAAAAAAQLGPFASLRLMLPSSSCLLASANEKNYERNVEYEKVVGLLSVDYWCIAKMYEVDPSVYCFPSSSKESNTPKDQPTKANLRVSKESNTTDDSA